MPIITDINVRESHHSKMKLCLINRSLSPGGQEGGRPRNKGTGGIREGGEEGAGSRIPKGAENRRKRVKLRNVAQ